MAELRRTTYGEISCLLDRRDGPALVDAGKTVFVVTPDCVDENSVVFESETEASEYFQALEEGESE